MSMSSTAGTSGARPPNASECILGHNWGVCCKEIGHSTRPLKWSNEQHQEPISVLCSRCIVYAARSNYLPAYIVVVVVVQTILTCAQKRTSSQLKSTARHRKLKNKWNTDRCIVGYTESSATADIVPQKNHIYAYCQHLHLGYILSLTVSV